MDKTRKPNNLTKAGFWFKPEYYYDLLCVQIDLGLFEIEKQNYFLFDT